MPLNAPSAISPQNASNDSHGFLKTAVFLLTGLTLLLIISAINRHMVIKTVYNPAYVRIPDTVETLITGASDMQFGLNPDDLINAISVARPAENYFYAYYKLTFILNSSNGIKNIVMGFNAPYLSSNREKDLRSEQFHNVYFALLDREGYRITFQSSRNWYYLYAKYHWGLPIELRKELRILLNGLLGKKSVYDYPFCEGFKRHKGTGNFLIDTYYAHAFLNATGGLAQRSEIMIEYLEKIALLCRKKNVRLYLVGAPIHPSFMKLIPPYYEKLAGEVLEKLKTIHPEVYYHDYRRSILSDDCFFDATHLNTRGSIQFSRKVRALLMDNHE